MALTKADIAVSIQSGMGFTKKRSVDCTEILLAIIKETLAAGENIMVSGFGKFSVKSKRRRKGRNPATGNDLMLPARKVVTFKSSGKLREKINLKDPS